MNWNALLLCVVLPFFSAMILVFWIHPKIVEIAKNKDIVDKPNRRKLQHEAVPVLGGIAVFWGLVLGAGLTGVFFESNALFPSLVATTVMLFLGTTDDILGLSPSLRLVVEIVLIAFVIKMEGVSINDFHGLLGLGQLPQWISISISILAGAGIINAINLIDGVDGLSSGFCLMACTIFCFAFVTSGSYKMATLTALCAGSLLPFFLHNVFGRKSKMFIGDGGTLMMGILMSEFTFHIIATNSKVAFQYTNMGVVAFTLAVLSIPVFDTLRVMTARIIKGGSPFHADKTHLHHLFIDLGFSHTGTAITVLILNMLNISCWLATYQLGGDATAQLLCVLITGILTTTVPYYTVRHLSPSNPIIRTLKWIGKRSHIENKSYFLRLRLLLDKI